MNKMQRMTHLVKNADPRAGRQARELVAQDIKGTLALMFFVAYLASALFV